MPDRPHSRYLCLPLAALTLSATSSGRVQARPQSSANVRSGEALVLTASGCIPNTRPGYPFTATVGADGALYIAHYATASETGGSPYSYVAKLAPGDRHVVYTFDLQAAFPYAIAVDAQGRAYVAGWAFPENPTIPAVQGPDLTPNGNWDTFVARIRADGAGLDYCGYIGGRGDDRAASICVDESGCAYVAGSTTSREDTFPVRRGPDLTYNHPRGSYSSPADAWVAKVRPDGSGLEYCGYIGGKEPTYASEIGVTPSGEAWVCGTTFASERTFPVRGGPGLSYRGGYGDAWIARVRADGRGLVTCGYISGKRDDVARALTVDQEGNVYLTGETRSRPGSFPVRQGPILTYRGSWVRHEGDAWAAKVTPAGRLEYCGYLGGDYGDYGTAIAVDSQGRAYVGGVTGSPQDTFPARGGPLLRYNGGPADAFLACISPVGRLETCGYLGGRGDEAVSAIGLVADGRLVAVGKIWRRTDGFPILLPPGSTLAAASEESVFVAELELREAAP